MARIVEDTILYVSALGFSLVLWIVGHLLLIMERRQSQ
jgi:hypothetical protein